MELNKQSLFPRDGSKRFIHKDENDQYFSFGEYNFEEALQYSSLANLENNGIIIDVSFVNAKDKNILKNKLSLMYECLLKNKNERLKKAIQQIEEEFEPNIEFYVTHIKRLECQIFLEKNFPELLKQDSLEAFQSS